MTDASGDPDPCIVPAVYRDISEPDVKAYPELGVKVIDIETVVPAVSVVVYVEAGDVVYFKLLSPPAVVLELKYLYKA